VSQHLQFLIVGLGVGAAFAALAMSLVVVYRGTGIINFAQGAMALWTAFAYDELVRAGDLVLPWYGLPARFHLGSGIAPGIALAIAVASSASIGVLAHLLVFRPLRRAPALAKVVASVGLMISLQALTILHFGTATRAVTPLLPTGRVALGDVSFAADRLYLPAIALAIALLLWSFFRFTRIGVATRAASENELGASLAGWSPDRLALLTWVLSSVVGGAVVALVAPATGLPANYVLAVVPALAVALVGGLSSVWLACLAGLALGAVQSEVVLLATKPWWPDWAASGLADVVPLVVIVVALFVVGRKLPVRGSQLADRLPDAIRPRNRPWAIALLAGGAGIAIALTSGSYRFGVVTSLILMLMAASFVVLTGFVGQISLAQAALAGAAGFLLSHVFGGWPFPLSMVASALAAGAIGLLVGAPALRVRGAQLAVVTLAGALALEQFVFRNPRVSPVEGNPIEPARLFGLDLAVRGGGDLMRLPFALMVLAVVVAALVLVGNLLRGHSGRAFLAVRSNERAAAAAGIDVTAVKLAAIFVAGTLAGLAGTLIGYSRGELSVDSFTVTVGLSLLAFAYIGGITSLAGAIVAGLLAPLGIVYVLLEDHVELGSYYLLFSGVLLMVNAVLYPSGVTGRLREQWAALRGRRAAARPAGPAAAQLDSERSSSVA